MQMDAAEFLSVLFERLENILKETKQQNILEKHFGGKLVQEIIPKNCGHISQRLEDFFLIQV